jgi:hypothetical protein
MCSFNDLPNEAQKVDKSFVYVKDGTSPKKSTNKLSIDSPNKVLHLDVFKGKYPYLLSLNHSVVSGHSRINL